MKTIITTTKNLNTDTKAMIISITCVLIAGINIVIDMINNGCNLN